MKNMHTPEQQELLAKVEQLKREKKYSQNEVAKVIGISGTALSQVKNENYPADPQSIFDIIANYFGVKEKAKMTYTEIDYAPTSISTKIYDIINVCHQGRTCCRCRRRRDRQNKSGSEICQGSSYKQYFDNG